MQPFCHRKGPKVAVTFHTKANTLTRITLRQSEYCKWFIDKDSNLTKPVCDWMAAYINKEELPSLPIALASLPPFTKQVLQTLKEISEPVSYQELALLVNNPKASRAVGSACNRNPFPLIIPCHRVLNSGGKIGGFAFGQAIKYELLKFEFPYLARQLLKVK